MTRTVAKMFSSHATAHKAAEELKSANFRDVHIFTGEGSGCSHDDHVDAMTKAYLLKAHAQKYAEGLKNGKTLVAVHAPWGSQDEAHAILDSFGPVDCGVPGHQVKSVAWNEHTPMSSALIAPVLAKTNRPFEKVMNVRSTTKSIKHVSSIVGMGGLKSKSPLPLSAAMGLAPLSRNATPLSSRLGLPLLAKKRHFVTN